MALDILASLAVATLAAAEVLSPVSLNVSSFLIAASISLLILAFAQSYLIIAFLLTLSFVCFAALRNGGALGNSEPSCSYSYDVGPWPPLKQSLVGILPAAFASVFHMLALWTLPFCILYSCIDARSDPKFVVREVGHLLAGTFFIVNLVLLPILLLPKSHGSESVRNNQLMECIFFAVFGSINAITFRTAHHLSGNDPPIMSEFNWDHELLGVVFVAASLVGIISSLQNISTCIHVVFPTAFVALSMQSHTNSQHMDMSEVHGWTLSWMKLHMLHGTLFLAGALCRLVGRSPEAIFFFYIGSFTFVMSSKWVVQEMHSAFNDPDDPDSATDQLLCLLVATLATASYALFFGTAMRLRLFLNMDSDAACGKGSFQALATDVPASKDEVVKFCSEPPKSGSLKGNEQV